MCQFRHEPLDDTSNKVIEEEIDETDEMKEATKVETYQNNCKSCKLDFPVGKKIYKCEECELNVCDSCSKLTLIEEDWFMCMSCQ